MSRTFAPWRDGTKIGWTPDTPDCGGIFPDQLQLRANVRWWEVSERSGLQYAAVHRTAIRREPRPPLIMPADKVVIKRG